MVEELRKHYGNAEVSPLNDMLYLDHLPYPKNASVSQCRDVSWPAYVMQENHLIATLKPRYDYRKDIPNYDGFNPSVEWQAIMNQTPLGKNGIEYAEREAEEKAREFIDILERHRQQHPFFYFSPEFVREAYMLAYAVHYGQKRVDGTDYISHPKSAVYKLLDEIVEPSNIKKPVNLTYEIMVVLLHDVPEDATQRQWIPGRVWGGRIQESENEEDINNARERVERYIKKCFKGEISSVIADLTKFSNRNRGKELPDKTTQSVQARIWSVLQNETITKEARDILDFYMLVYSSCNELFPTWTSFLLKLPDKLHNLGTLQELPRDKQKRIAQGVLDWYVPLVILLGMNTLAKKMEDICYKYVLDDPKQYGTYESQWHRERKQLRPAYKQEQQRLQQMLAPYGYTVECREDRLGRLIAAYQLFQKHAISPHDTFEEFLLLYRSPLKLTIIVPDNGETPESRTRVCEDAYRHLMEALGNTCREISCLKHLETTSSSNLGGDLNPPTNHKIEIVYEMQHRRRRTVKIVTRNMDHQNQYGSIEKDFGDFFITPIVSNQHLEQLLNTIIHQVGHAEGEKITEEVLREQLAHFRDISLGTYMPPDQHEHVP